MPSHLIGGKLICPNPPLACRSWGRMSVPSPLELGLDALAEDYDPRGVFLYLGGSRSNGASSASRLAHPNPISRMPADNRNCKLH